MREQNYTSFYKGKSLIASELRKHIANLPEPPESFLEFCRRMRIITGQGRPLIEKIFEEDYPNMKIENDRVIPRE